MARTTRTYEASLTRVSTLDQEAIIIVSFNSCEKKPANHRLQSAVVDIWTSPSSSKTQFLDIYVHFIGRETQRLPKAINGFRAIVTHAGAEQAAFLLPVLENYNVLKKIG